MKTVLLDENVPRQVRKLLPMFSVSKVQEMGIGSIKNGKLIEYAEGKFDVLVTADKSIPYQQNLKGRTLAIVVIRPKLNKMAFIIPMMNDVIDVISRIQPGEIIVVK